MCVQNSNASDDLEEAAFGKSDEMFGYNVFRIWFGVERETSAAAGSTGNGRWNTADTVALDWELAFSGGLPHGGFDTRKLCDVHEHV